MFDFDYITKEDRKEHNPSWPEIPGNSYWKLMFGSSRYGKTNA